MLANTRNIIADRSVSKDDIRFARERFADVIEEGKPLLMQHWAEIAVHKDIPLDPEWSFYQAMDDAGALKIFTARKDGVLIGYAVFVVRPRHAHYAISWAVNDIVWIHPDHRNMGVGSAFAAYWDAALRDLGVTVVSIDTKVAHPALMYLLKDCGYATVVCGMEKRLR